MRLLPFDRFEFVSPLPLEELVARLNRYVEARKLFRAFMPSTPFIGKVTSRGFKLHYNGRSPTLVVVIKGSFRDEGDRVRIIVRQRAMRLPFVPLVVLTLAWLPGILDGIEAGNYDAAIFIAGVFSFFFVFITASFWWHARHTEEYLADIFQAQSIDDRAL